MKLLEYGTEQAFDTLIAIMAEVEKITASEDYQEYINKKRAKGKQQVNSNAFARLLYGPEYRDATMNIMALADGKTAEDIRAMPYAESAKLMNEILRHPEIASFFVP